MPSSPAMSMAAKARYGLAVLSGGRGLEKSPCVVSGRLADQGIALGVVEDVCAVLPEALMDVHAGAVVAVERLGHEGRHLIVPVGDVLDDVLVPHHLVGHGHQSVELHVDLGLAGSRNLMVVDLDGD